MTPLTIIPLRDCDPATLGKPVACFTCDGRGDFGELGEIPCNKCRGRGHTVTHDLTTGALANPYKVGGGPMLGVADNETSLTFYEATIRKRLISVLTDPDIWQQVPHWMHDATVAALSAIRPGDSLAHDGSELGAKCAAVVAKVAMERWK